ncbi:alpha/beta hydrolase [Ilumatobacter sp.]|uniref:alpha/beta hydrolase n=1 Tax=Ilumatobacter sp. TaxID=1967498 RepID=UPI003C528464
MSELEVMDGCEPFAHVGSASTGVLVLHGFTGNPSSMAAQAQAFAAAGYHVEQPRLPGHGTTLADMQTTCWSDWSDEAAAAYDRLVERADRIVVIGLSMGGTLTLWTGLQRLDDDRLKGLICVNAATTPHDPEMVELVEGLLEDGVEVSPSIGGDIADPDAVEIAYEGTPLRQLLSLTNDGLAPIADRYGELEVPLLIFSSTDDHVVPPDNSAHLRDTAGGDVDFVTLERSFHVATQDFDRELINERSLAFIERVTR